MKPIQRMIAILLACVLAIGLFPGDLGDAFTVEAKADWEGGTINSAIYDANTVFRIKTTADWNALAGFSSTNNFAGKTVYLDADISLGGTIRSFEAFSGTFEGNRHKITLRDNPAFNALSGTPGQNGGLFRKMTGGNIRRLIVEIDADKLWSNTRSPDPTAGFESSDSVPFRAGVIAGHITVNSEISECAVVSSPGRSATFYHYRGWSDHDNEMSAGGIVGKVENSNVSKCFVNINIESALTDDDNGVWLYTGGIAGWVRGGTVESCGFWGDIQYYHPYPSYENYGHSGAGGAVGYAQGASTAVKDNYVIATMTLYDLHEDGTTATKIKTELAQRSLAKAGGAVGKIEAHPAVGLNYGIMNIYYYENGVQKGPVGAVDLPGSIQKGVRLTSQNTSSLGTSAWGEASSGTRMLKWMLEYSDADTITIDTGDYINGNVTVTIDPPFVDLNLNGKIAVDPPTNPPTYTYTYESTHDAPWYAYLSYPTLGRQPTPSGLTMEAGGGAQSVNSITVAAPNSGTILYGGIAYEFQAAVTGTNLASSFPADYPVSFQYEYLDSGNAVVGTLPANATGDLNIPHALPATAEKLRVTPVCAIFAGACQPKVYDLKPSIDISVAGSDIPYQGTQVQMQAALAGSSAFVGSAVTWSVSGAAGTTGIDAAGLLTIDQAQTGNIAVQAEVAGATKTFDVSVTPQIFALAPATPAPTNISLTVTAGVPVSLTSSAAADWVVSGTGILGTITPNAGAITTIYTPAVDDTAVTATSAPDEAAFNITVRPTAAQTAGNTTVTGNTRGGAAVELNSISTGTIGKITTTDSKLNFEYLVSAAAVANPEAETWMLYSSVNGILLDPVTTKYVYIRTAADNVKNVSNYLTYEHYTGDTWVSTGIAPDAGLSSETIVSAPQQVDPASGSILFTGLSNQAGGTISVSVYPGNPRYGSKTNGNAKSDFFCKTEKKVTLGGVSETPMISLNTDISLGHGVLITSSAANTQIYYTTAVNGATPEPPTTSSTLYTGMIAFPPTATEFVVWAIAMDSGASKASQVAKATFRKDDLSKAEPPELRMGDGLIFSSDTWYEPGTAVHFEHAQYDRNDTASGANLIRFIVDGGSPSITSGTSYNPNSPYVLPGNKDSVTVRAVLIDSANRLESELLEQTIKIRQKLPAPEPVVYDGVNHSLPTRPGSSAYLNFSSEAIEQLGTSGGNFELITYGSATDPSDYILPDAAEPQPMVGMTYLSYTVTEGDSVTLPQIRYQTGSKDVAAEGIPYTYGVRKVTIHPGSNNQASTTSVSYINPTAIRLEGNPRETFQISVLAVSGAATYSDSLPKTYTYSFRDAVTELTSYPRTTVDSPASVQSGDIIELTSSPTAMIFYSTGNNLPKIAYENGAWVIKDGNTRQYDPNNPIKVEGSSRLIYTINAIAVDPADSLESSSKSFPYQLPAPVQAVTANPAAGSVVLDSKITLYCATEGATIYYTTNGDEPVPFESSVYDPKNPPAVTKKMTLTVLAELNGVTSEVNTYEYKIAGRMPEPETSLPTGNVVSKGTRIVLSAGGTIAYTTDGKDPRSILESDSESSEGNKVFYGNTVVIDGDYGESITIRAYSYRSGYTPSETVSFTYTVCERDDYLVSNPVSGSVVTPGSTIQLSTSVTNGKIFYTVGDALPQVNNTGAGISINDDSSYREFIWEAAQGTTQGATIPVTGQPGSTFTVRAIAVTDGADGGAPRVFNFKVNERSDAPTSSIPSGAITFNGATTLLTAKQGAAIYYTTDGTDPTTSSYRYKDPIRLESSIILKAMAIEDGKEPSEIVEYTYTQAGYTAAVTLSVTGGEVAQGTEVAMVSLTEGATIYYTTNGTEPTTDSQVYTAPIPVMRPVTFKAMAYLQGLHPSPVNTTTFTVVEPPAEAEGEEDDPNRKLTQTDRLTSRRTYDEYVGPTYTDVIIQDYEVGALLAAEEGVVEKDIKLIVREVATTPDNRNTVRAEMDYNIVQLYDIFLEQGGEKVQPKGTVEVGLPIPPENRNGIVVVVCLGDDGTLEAFPTRRSDNMAYFMTNHFSKYAIVVPEAQQGTSGGMILLIGLLSGLGTLLAAGVVFLVWKRRRKQKDGAQKAEEPQ